MGQVLEMAVQVLVEKLERQKLAATDRPRTSRGVGSGSRAIPAAVKRAVWKRDDGQCAFVAESGRRCTLTGFLEFHHVVPFARGGQAVLENIALRCRAHNQYEARLEFGSRDLPLVRESFATWGECKHEPEPAGSRS
jgi:5-methylcytosine-specific restriction endonuclease McrA